jgi:hypothetical protein
MFDKYIVVLHSNLRVGMIFYGLKGTLFMYGFFDGDACSKFSQFVI